MNKNYDTNKLYLVKVGKVKNKDKNGIPEILSYPKQYFAKRVNRFDQKTGKQLNGTFYCLLTQNKIVLSDDANTTKTGDFFVESNIYVPDKIKSTKKIPYKSMPLIESSLNKKHGLKYNPDRIK